MECWYSKGCEDYNTEECNLDCHTYNSMLRAFQKSNLPKKYWVPFSLNVPSADAEVYATLSKIKSTIDEFVHEGKNLLLISPKCGNGKTSWAVKLAQAYIDRAHWNCINKRPAFYVYIPDLLMESRRAISGNTKELNEIIKGIRGSHLVIWHYFGSVALTNYDMIMVQSLLENRINAGWSNIFTTNLEKELFEKNVGSRLFDRVYNLSKRLEFKAGSMRKDD